MKINNFGSNLIGTKEVNNNRQSSEVVKRELASTVNNEQRTDINADNHINDEMLENSIKQANKSLEQFSRIIERTVHEKTHTIMYVLKDTSTQEIIKEFPSRKIQDMIAKMWEMAGILVDERR